MTASRASIVFLAVLAVVLCERPARAGPALAPAEPDSARIIEMLQSPDLPAPGESSLAHHLARVDVSGKYGLIYTRRLALGETGMRLRLRGPALGRETAVGLSFEIRF